ncbi:C45 family autoproteolytic acyltransferase/hydolase [Acidimangrovimonas pyrenivorans]|uniref:C45 family autoproteolytic acyltransferase/hydrolase n=1 Tax=Acidimangrovimonas pyrenivorans TaxID=2030798 RepID=A0ABV7ALJ2_9RHOB
MKGAAMSDFLTQFAATGTAREIGFALGRFGRQAVQGKLCRAPAWQGVVAEADSDFVTAMAARVRADFPEIWDEIEGLAEGLELPLAEVFAWNCRGDIWAGAPDGCTSVMVPGSPAVLAHNEDGLPLLAPHCGLVEARPKGATGFVSFVYPGSIPGHTFAVNAAGLAMTVNNIRATRAGAGLPRMVLGRAVLACTSLDEAVALLRETPRAGGFHYALAQAGNPRLLSVEFCGDGVSVREIAAAEAHANHLIHPAMAGVAQQVTESSRDRQARADALVGAAPLAILADHAGPGLPILRRAEDDPDDENTIATARFEIGAGVHGTVHVPGDPAPAFRVSVTGGELALTRV